MKRAIVLLSGGQDSTTVLFQALAEGWSVEALTVNYGQAHALELQAARKVVDIALRYYGAQMYAHLEVDVPNVLRGTSPLVRRGHGLEQYDGFHSLPGGVEKTFVPLRNQFFITLAANYAVHRGCSHLFIGVSQEDYGGYPDCRQDFLLSMQETLDLGLRDVATVTLLSPLLFETKADTVRKAASIRGCWEALAWSHTAYDGKYPPTGRDHASLLRAKGFFEAGLPDPLVVRACREGLMPVPATDNYAELRVELHQRL